MDENILKTLTPLEKQQVIKILNEIKSGKNIEYKKLVNDIWEEIPVDIDTFIDDERYMRNYFYSDGKSCLIYPRWRTELKNIFEDPYKYNEICFTGGIGLGKSEAAKIGVCYLLYRTMCLKNPQLFYNKPIGKPIVFFFFNNNLTLANEVLLKPFVEMLMTSNWFMDRGEILGREHLRYKSHKNIVLAAGSKDTHALGQDTFCLHGDTEIITYKGIYKIKELENKNVKLFTFNYKENEYMLSDYVKIVHSKDVNTLIELTLNDSTIIKCTPEHKFMLKNGNYKEAKDILLDDVLINNVTVITKNELFLKKLEPVYDVINVKPYNNFVINTKNNCLISHNCAILDEINFAPGSDMSIEKSKIMSTYSNINTRITNRFRVEGNVHGKLFMVSSKKSEYDFLEQYAQKMKDQPNFYMVDDKVWNIVPREKTGYSGKMFNLAIGGDILPSKIIPDDETIEDYEKQGYDILQVPIEEKQKFVLNMERSLMDIAAVSVSYVTKFLNYDIISKCYCEDENPFSQEIITTGIKDNLKIEDFFLLEKIPKEIRKKPIFIHIDTSLTGDRTGIGATGILGKVKKEEFDIQANKTIRTYKSIYKHIFNVEIQCPKNSEISFQKTRNFILYLRQCGFNICGITTDGYQSSDTRQLLLSEGFENVERLNFERTPDIYMTLRNSLIEERIKLLKINCLERELLRVERNNQTGKINHPENTGDGHGDGADALSGSLYDCVIHENEYSDILTELHMLSPVDEDLTKEEILKIAAGVSNLQLEEQMMRNKEFEIQHNIQQKEKKHSMVDWIL